MLQVKVSPTKLPHPVNPTTQPDVKGWKVVFDGYNTKCLDTCVLFQTRTFRSKEAAVAHANALYLSAIGV